MSFADVVHPRTRSEHSAYGQAYGSKASGLVADPRPPLTPKPRRANMVNTGSFTAAREPLQNFLVPAEGRRNGGRKNTLFNGAGGAFHERSKLSEVLSAEEEHRAMDADDCDLSLLMRGKMRRG